MAKQKHNKTVATAVEDLFRLPMGTVGSGCKISMIGNREMCIEGCKGILEYGEEIMRLHCGDRQVKVMGRALSVKVLERNYAEIEGVICTVEFA